MILWTTDRGGAGGGGEVQGEVPGEEKGFWDYKGLSMNTCLPQAGGPEAGHEGGGAGGEVWEVGGALWSYSSHAARNCCI